MSKIKRILGDYDQALSNSPESLTIAFSPGAISPGTVPRSTASPGAISPGAVSREAVSCEAVSCETTSPGAVSRETASPGTTSRETASSGTTSRETAFHQRHWRKNTLAANFIADYCVSFLPEPVDAEGGAKSASWQVDLQDQVNFIANELLENAMKFCDRTVDVPIGLTLRLFPDSLVFEVSNALSSSAAEQFQAIIQELLAENPNTLLLRQLERNAVEQSPRSQLGFLTIMSDYQARMGWKFEPLPQAEAEPDHYLVTIMVYLKL